MTGTYFSMKRKIGRDNLMILNCYVYEWSDSCLSLRVVMNEPDCINLKFVFCKPQAKYFSIACGLTIT